MDVKITLNTALAGLIIWNLQQLHVQRSERNGNNEKDREEMVLYIHNFLNLDMRYKFIK